MSTHAVRRCGLSTAQLARLDHACRIIDAAFGEPPYLVGSANDRNDFRDVDVRLILADAEFDAMFGGREQFWGLFCLAVTYYLAEVSGLPVDFQVQRRTEANEKHKGMRNPLGLLHKVRFAGGGDATMFAAMSDAETGAATLTGLNSIRKATIELRGGQWCDEHLCDRFDCRAQHSAPEPGWQDPPFNDEGGTW